MLFLRHPLSETLRRLPQVVLGLVVFGVGISLLICAELGSAPWDVFHQGLARQLGLGIGSVIIGVGLLLLLLFIPLREPIGLGALLNAVLIGLTADTFLALVETPSALWGRALMMLAAPVVVGLGTGLYLGGGLGPGPRDGLMTGISKRGFTIWKVRTALEATVLICGAVLGGRLGLGTVWFVVAVGPCVQWFLRHFGPVRPPAPALATAQQR